MTHSSNLHPNKTSNSNVISMFDHPAAKARERKIIRIAPELDGLQMLYANSNNADKLYTVKILCWALLDDGDVIGLTPWINKVVSCETLEDNLEGHYEGYYDAEIDHIFYEPPAHKIAELQAAAEYYQFESDDPDVIIQDIPDTIGTHAVFMNEDKSMLMLTEIHSWRLMNDGVLEALAIDKREMKSTPVLLSDDCLFPIQYEKHFKYFFHNNIARKIKDEDPDAIAAISELIN